MIVHNFLPAFAEALRKWEKRPTPRQLLQDYGRYCAPWVDEGDLLSPLAELEWAPYRERCLRLDPAREEARLRKHLQSIEQLFGFELAGDIVLFSSLEAMDGYAAFDQGSHTVYLGVDESFDRGSYIDILTTHELTHVARESRASTWTGWGLNPDMSQREFWDTQPVIEHVFGEGLSCTVSELLVPGQDAWLYAYQNEDSLKRAYDNAAAIDACIHREIRLPHAQADYSRLYNPSYYRAPVPSFSQYLWGWQWTRELLRGFAGGDARKLVETCSRDFMENAAAFRLNKT